MWCEVSIQCVLLRVDVRGSQPQVSDRLHSPPRSAPGVLVENHRITDKRVYSGTPRSIPLVGLSVCHCRTADYCSFGTPPTSHCFFKIVWAVRGALRSHMNFRVDFSVSATHTKMPLRFWRGSSSIYRLLWRVLTSYQYLAFPSMNTGHPTMYSHLLSLLPATLCHFQLASLWPPWLTLFPSTTLLLNTNTVWINSPGDKNVAFEMKLKFLSLLPSCIPVPSSAAWRKEHLRSRALERSSLSVLLLCVPVTGSFVWRVLRCASFRCGCWRTSLLLCRDLLYSLKLPHHAPAVAVFHFMCPLHAPGFWWRSPACPWARLPGCTCATVSGAHVIMRSFWVLELIFLICCLVTVCPPKCSNPSPSPLAMSTRSDFHTLANTWLWTLEKVADPDGKVTLLFEFAFPWSLNKAEYHLLCIFSTIALPFPETAFLYWDWEKNGILTWLEGVLYIMAVHALCAYSRLWKFLISGKIWSQRF